MTVYLFIDLPFNEIGFYPFSLRDEGKKRSKRRVKRCCFKGETIFLFLMSEFLRWDPDS